MALQNIAQRGFQRPPSGTSVAQGLAPQFANLNQRALQQQQLMQQQSNMEAAKKQQIIQALGRLLGTGAGGAIAARTGQDVGTQAAIGGAFGGGDFGTAQEMIFKLAQQKQKEQAATKLAEQKASGGGPQIVQLPGGGFAVIPGRVGSPSGAGSTITSPETDVTGTQGATTEQSIPLGKQKKATVKQGGITRTFETPTTPEEKATALAGKVTETEAVAKARAGIARAVKQQDIKTNFNTTASLFKNLIAQIRGQEQEQGGLGLVKGLYGKINTAFKNPKFSRTASVAGQRRETALTLNRILTGQNRVIKGVLEMINETLPTQTDPNTFVANKTAQSLKNAFGITRAFQKAGLTPDVLNNMSQSDLNKINPRQILSQFTLTPEENQEIEAIIEDVLATPATQTRTLGGGETTLTTPSGVQFKIIGGGE